MQRRCCRVRRGRARGRCAPRARGHGGCRRGRGRGCRRGRRGQQTESLVALLQLEVVKR